MRSAHDAIGEIIGGIGRPGFATHVAHTLRRFSGFDLSAIFVHGPGASTVLSDNFAGQGWRQGIENYARVTHRVNSALGRRRRGHAVRASDFRLSFAALKGLEEHLISAPHEELGYRTIGWPPDQEEVALYLPDLQGVIEIGLYRARGGRPAPGALLEGLEALTIPLGAAFARHAQLEGGGSEGPWQPLTRREREIVELMLIGCSSSAMASRLGISRHTVKDHRKHIFAKLGISSLAELFSLARDPLSGGMAPHPAIAEKCGSAIQD